MLHLIVSEVVGTAINRGFDHINKKLIEELSKLENYRLYRDIIPRVTVVG